MKKLSLLVFLVFSSSVFADRMPLPASTPSSFKTECGSCHLAYPPALLAAKDWQKTMSGLSEHFGTDATVDSKIGREIAAFLEQNAGRPEKIGDAGEPPRISKTARFVRKHREVPATAWRDPQVKSAANCESCHRRAAQGSFSEREITLPYGRQ